MQYAKVFILGGNTGGSGLSTADILTSGALNVDITPTTDLPQTKFEHCMAKDPVSGRVFLVGDYESSNDE